MVFIHIHVRLDSVGARVQRRNNIGDLVRVVPDDVKGSRAGGAIELQAFRTVEIPKNRGRGPDVLNRPKVVGERVLGVFYGIVILIPKNTPTLHKRVFKSGVMIVGKFHSSIAYFVVVIAQFELALAWNIVAAFKLLRSRFTAEYASDNAPDQTKLSTPKGARYSACNVVRCNRTQATNVNPCVSNLIHKPPVASEIGNAANLNDKEIARPNRD
jgi:hypothetical protein